MNRCDCFLGHAIPDSDCLNELPFQALDTLLHFYWVCIPILFLLSHDHVYIFFVYCSHLIVLNGKANLHIFDYCFCNVI